MVTWRFRDVREDELGAFARRAGQRLAGSMNRDWRLPLERALDIAASRVAGMIQSEGSRPMVVWCDEGDGDLWMYLDGPIARVTDLAIPGWMGDEHRRELRSQIENTARALGATRIALRRSASTSTLPLDGLELSATQMLRDLSTPAPPDLGVRLREMSPEDFAAFVDWLVEDYAAETAKAGTVNPETAREASRRSLDALLPNGTASDGHDLMVGAVEGVDVGRLWLGRQPGAPEDHYWVYDVVVNEGMRGLGHGRGLMVAGELLLRDRGANFLGLNVFGHNHVARSLYVDLGYETIEEQFIGDL